MATKYKSLVEKFIKLGEQKCFISCDQGRVKYQAIDKSYNALDPEEQIR